MDFINNCKWHAKMMSDKCMSKTWDEYINRKPSMLKWDVARTKAYRIMVQNNNAMNRVRRRT